MRLKNFNPELAEGAEILASRINPHLAPRESKSEGGKPHPLDNAQGEI